MKAKKIMFVGTDINTNAKLHFEANEGEVQQQLEAILRRGKWKIEKSDAVESNHCSSGECKCANKGGKKIR